MPKIEDPKQRTFRIIVLIISIAALILGLVISPLNQDQIMPLVLMILIVGVIEILPVRLFNNYFSLIHIALFSAGLLYGTGLAVTANLVGVFAATTFSLFMPSRFLAIPAKNASRLWGTIFNFGISSFTIVTTFLLFGINQGISALDFNKSLWWLEILGAGLVYGTVHGLLYFTSMEKFGSNPFTRENWDILALISIEILPMFFGFISLLLYPIVADGTIIILGVANFALGLLIFYLDAPRKNLERRLDELSALEAISKVLSSDIDLERLLSSIQVQLTGLLDVDNFYVALLDPVDQQIWYPLAVKHGIRQTWQRRPLTDRLTDRVILEAKPILLANNASQHLSQIGLPTGEDDPYAWIGVPLITSKHTIGCLALFSMSRNTEFTQDDMNLLSILSGQTSVAIEIALHNALLSSDITIGRDRLTTILNSVHDGLMLIDAEGKITLINEAVSVLTGLPQSEFIGHKLTDLPAQVADLIGFSNARTGKILDALMTKHNLTTEKITYQMVNRSPELFIERSIIQVEDGSNTLSGLIINLKDITDEYQLKQTQNLISETLVHDLRSPLSSTISALDVIYDAHASGDPAGILEPSIQIAQRSSKRMLAMVESILEINRMESGRIDLNLSSIDLVELLSESIAELKPLAIDYGVRIIFDSNIKIPPVRLDKNKIQRVLNNLIDNALKFSPQDGEIKVTIELQNQEFVEIHVLDRGPGIPDKYIHSIFDRFFQIPDRPSRKRGSGLGLTYCRLAVEAHKGKIWVEQRPAGGSNFALSLPISVDQK